jgi:phosphoribosylformimino-5-aminoimidazole carboxamide ribotide isomerase
MNLFPATDIIGAKAVRLVKGDYDKMTIYGDPLEIAKEFRRKGAVYLHAVDLEGAKNGDTPNFDTIKKLIDESGLLVEIGGGIRTIDTVKKYLDAGAFRVILGTAAVKDRAFLESAVKEYGERIAVGVDIKDGYVAIKGWTEVSELECSEFCEYLQSIGVKTVICTDISKDGLLSGTNIELYRELSKNFNIDIVASGGITSVDEVKILAEMKIYGAILGKSLYEGTIDLEEAIKVANV